jgi:hypothetical protein
MSRPRLSLLPTGLAFNALPGAAFGCGARGHEHCFSAGSMRSAVLGLGWLLMGVVAACGGRTATSSEGDDGSSEIADPDPPDSRDPKGEDSGDFPADTELGECRLGEMSWDVAGGCAWIADNRCYATREMACNCACPRERNSQCSSGFDKGPDGRVWVDCY